MEFVRYSPGIEVKQPDEDELIGKIIENMSGTSKSHFDKHRHAVRGVHAKIHGTVIGHLEIYNNLPEYLAQGIFAKPTRYPVVIRFSSSPPDLLDDRLPVPHGMAIKAIGVPGKKILPGQENEATQDLVLIGTVPVFIAGDVQKYWNLLRENSRVSLPDSVEVVAGKIAGASDKVLHFLGMDNALLDALGVKNEHLLGQTFYSMAAIRYGNYVAKICVAPLSPEVKELTGKVVDADGHPSIDRDLIVAFFHENGAEYEVRAQLCTNLEKMPVEDASIRWPEEESPYQPIAKIVIPRQEAYSPERRVYVDDRLTFTPWHSIPEHQPLGSIMRSRLKAYEVSSAFRHQMNAVKRVEPRDISEIPE